VVTSLIRAARPLLRHPAQKTAQLTVLQSNRVRVLVITLRTIENEFEECVASIDRQTYRNFSHLVFEDLPSTEANRVLYQTFMDRADEFDLLMRVDADMVLENENLLASIVDTMAKRRSVDLFTMDIHDFFTDRLISGLNVYRNTVQFPVDDPFQPERPIVSKANTLVDQSKRGFAVRHCKNPSTLQALHYGIHRGVKLREWMRRNKLRRSHWYAWTIWRTWQNFLTRRDRRLAFAVLGGELGLQGLFKVEHLSHQTELPRRVLGLLEKSDGVALEEMIRRIRRKTWGGLPAPLRICALRCTAIGRMKERDLERFVPNA